MNTTTIYLVRHARADWHADEARALSLPGRKGAQALAGSLGSLPITAIYSSPSRRSIETVTPLAQQVGVRPKLVPNLRERELPVVASDQFLGMVQKSWRDPESVIEGGESNVSAQSGGLAAVRAIVAEHRDQHVVVATHGNLLTLILNGFDSTYGCEFWCELSFPDVYRLEFDNTALIRIERIWRQAA